MNPSWDPTFPKGRPQNRVPVGSAAPCLHNFKAQQGISRLGDLVVANDRRPMVAMALQFSDTGNYFGGEGGDGASKLPCQIVCPVASIYMSLPIPCRTSANPSLKLA